MDFPQPPHSSFAEYGVFPIVLLPLAAVLIFGIFTALSGWNRKRKDGSEQPQELRAKRERRLNFFCGLSILTAFVATVLFATDLAVNDGEAERAYGKTVSSFVQTHYGYELSTEAGSKLGWGDRVKARSAEGKEVSLILLKPKSDHPRLAKVTGKVEYAPVPPLAVAR